jgi:hypothetical protein
MQWKKSDEDNVTSYFASQDMDLNCSNLLLRVIKYYSIRLPKLIDTEYIAESSAENLWLKYHTKTFSAASLALKMYDMYPDLATELFRRDRARMVQLDDNSHNLALSRSLTDGMKVALYAFLIANRALPDKWYQGMKAWENAPLSAREGWRNLFEKLREKGDDQAYDPNQAPLDNARLMGLIG